MKPFSQFCASVMLAALAVAVVPPGNAHATVIAQSGDLIRGQTFPAVYYVGADGFRYVFPNSATYFTWYSDFSTVRTITDAELATLQIGGNVTYKPGVRMVKINSTPQTYAVERNGLLRHVSSENVAIALYGANWNRMIDDVPDGFFGNYTIGNPITAASQYSPEQWRSSVASINADMSLSAPAMVSVTGSGYSPASVTIQAGQSVRFTNNDDVRHSFTSEDLSWGSGTLQPGDSFIRTFDEEGTYGFFDSYDATNSGAVFVN